MKLNKISIKEIKNVKEIKVLVYTDALRPVVADLIKDYNDNGCKFSISSIESISDSILYYDADVVIVESGAYKNVINNIKICNGKLKTVPYLAVIHNDEPPDDPNIHYILAKEVTKNIVTQMIKMMYRSADVLKECPMVNQGSCTSPDEGKSKESVAKDLANIQKKYMPELIKMRDELAARRGANA
jgi:hypothetical protein